MVLSARKDEPPTKHLIGQVDTTHLPTPWRGALGLELCDSFSHERKEPHQAIEVPVGFEKRGSFFLPIPLKNLEKGGGVLRVTSTLRDDGANVTLLGHVIQLVNIFVSSAQRRVSLLRHGDRHPFSGKTTKSRTLNLVPRQVRPTSDSVFMNNHDDMDDLSKRRVAHEIGRITAVTLDVVELTTKIRDESGDESAISAHLLGLGVRPEVIATGLLHPVASMLGMVTERLFLSKLDRTAVSQVLFGVYQGRASITELDAVADPELRKQLRRLLDFALDETALLVSMDRLDKTPSVAWFLMSMVLDVLEATGVQSKM